MAHERDAQDELPPNDWWEFTMAEICAAQEVAADVQRCRAMMQSGDGQPCPSKRDQAGGAGCTGAIHVLAFAREFRRGPMSERHTLMVAFGALVARRHRECVDALRGLDREVAAAGRTFGRLRERIRAAVLEDLGAELEAIMAAEGLRHEVCEVQRCRRCGCTNARACAGGCEWVTDDLCSQCEVTS